MKLEWSEEALSDLDRFAIFLHDHHPDLAKIVAAALVDRAQVLCDHPEIGHLIGERKEYRQVVMRVLRTAYVFQYRYDGERLVMLRVFHGRESR